MLPCSDGLAFSEEALDLRYLSAEMVFLNQFDRVFQFRKKKGKQSDCLCAIQGNVS